MVRLSLGLIEYRVVKTCGAVEVYLQAMEVADQLHDPAT
jgi:hypothetical protein